MIKRFCDICGEELGKDYYSVKFPRIVRCKIRGGKGDAEICARKNCAVVSGEEMILWFWLFYA